MMQTMTDDAGVAHAIVAADLAAVRTLRALLLEERAALTRREPEALIEGNADLADLEGYGADAGRGVRDNGVDALEGEDGDGHDQQQSKAAQDDEYGDMLEKGIIYPAKVVRIALQDAASIAGLMITTEAGVAEAPKKEAGHANHGQGGMGGMM